MSTSVELIGFGEKDRLWRWDTNRQIRIIPETGSTIDEIRFSNIFFEKPLKVEPKTNEHGDIVADVPNILLQEIFPIDVQVIMFFNNGKQTIYNTSYKVENCKKPPEYVYTETEIKNYDDLEKRIAALEKGGTSGGIAEESDPTVPEWAKQPQKPTYTADEVGAASKEDIRKLSEDIADLKENGNGSGVTTAQANSLWAIIQKSAFAQQLTDAELNAFKTAWGIGGEVEPDIPDEPSEPDNPEVTLSSISATYNGGEVAVGTSLTDLTGITVKATYSDGSTANVTGYTLSGTIAEGSNTITVSYGGKTTTFTVTGVTESGGEDEPTAFGVSEISAKSIKYNNALISNTTSTEYNKGFKYAGKIVSINVEAGKTYMLMGLHSNLTATMTAQFSTGLSPVGDEPMAIDINADGTLGEVNTAFNPAYISLTNVDPYKTTGMTVSGKAVFWNGTIDALGIKCGTNFVENVDGTDYAWCVCIFTANIDFSGIVQWNGLTLVDENYFRIYEVDPNTEYNPYIDGVIGIGEECV